jgi:hypothetical protein
MQGRTEDRTLEKNYIQKWRFLIKEYEEVKEKRHPHFQRAHDFYVHHEICRQNFLKYYNRYKQSGDEGKLLPQKRGPKWKSRRPSAEIEQKVIEERIKGNNRYEIHAILKPVLKEKTPSPSGVYTILKREHLNRLKPT